MKKVAIFSVLKVTATLFFNIILRQNYSPKMAYFERRIETQKVSCLICKAKCAEPTIMRHRASCREKPENVRKFERGEFEKCSWDSNHIVERGMMDMHLEFCLKYQSIQKDKFQEIRARDKLADDFTKLAVGVKLGH